MGHFMSKFEAWAKFSIKTLANVVDWMFASLHMSMLVRNISTPQRKRVSLEVEPADIFRTIRSWNIKFAEKKKQLKLKVDLQPWLEQALWRLSVQNESWSKSFPEWNCRSWRWPCWTFHCQRLRDGRSLGILAEIFLDRIFGWFDKNILTQSAMEKKIVAQANFPILIEERTATRWSHAVKSF